MPQTFAQKALARAAGIDAVAVGQIVTVKPAHLLTHDNTSAIVAKIKDDLATHGVVRRDLSVIVIDHVAPAANEKTAAGHKAIREFVAQYGLENFYDVGEGICHQVVVEKGHARPGTIIVGSDSHTCSYGALNVFATGVDRTEAACLMLTGETWLKCPPTIRIDLRGSLSPGVSAKDLVLRIIGDIGADGANYCAVEFHGDVQPLSISQRFTIANMGIEMGAKIAVFPCDGRTVEYLNATGVKREDYDPLWGDDDAEFERVLDYDLSILEPVVAAPHSVDNVKSISAVVGTPIQQCLIGTCTNGRLSDLHEAASVLAHHKIAPGVRLLVLPASRKVYQQASEDGTLAKLVAAGADDLAAGLRAVPRRASRRACAGRGVRVDVEP